MPKIYRIDYHHADHGCLVEWAATYKGALRAVVKIKADDIAQAQDRYADALVKDLVEDGITYHNLKKVDHGSIRIGKVDFPSLKRDIVRWLNLHLDTDNG